jgi:two-component system NtrC family response regulator
LDGIPEDAHLSDTIMDIEKKMISRALKITGNIQSDAAQLLGIGKSGLNKKLKKHGIEVNGS